MNLYIKQGTSYYYPLLYVLKIIEKNQCINFTFLDSQENADIIWDHSNANSEYINIQFFNSLLKKNDSLKHNQIFEKSPIILGETGQEDLTATIFYLVNCLQELNPDRDSLDKFGRFKYTSSYQSKFNLIEENIVQQLIDAFCLKHNLTGAKTKSNFFISHDIDTIYGSFFQDGFWALKKMKIGVILNLIMLEMTRNPHWKNIDQILKIDSEYDIKSTFFWLVNKGKGMHGIKNADYNVSKEKKLLTLVEKANFINGLHKSCSNMSIDEELNKCNINTTYNRYHFLNFLPHKDWDEISDSKINFDCSLGFAEHYGFRNSYGKAFQPFDLNKNRPFNFVVSPLNFMDSTFHKYLRIPSEKVADIIIGIYEKNSTNCDFSLLWHNTFFTNYKFGSFLKAYKMVLAYIYENNIECVTPHELITRNILKW